MLSLNRRPDDPFTLAASRDLVTTAVAGYAMLADSAVGPVVVAQPLSTSQTPISLVSPLAFTGRAIVASSRSETAKDESAPATGLAALTLAGPSTPGPGAAPGDPVKPSAGLILPTFSSQSETESPAAGPVSPQIVINQAALASTQPQQIDFTGSNLPVFGSDRSFSFHLPSFLYQSFGVHTGVSFAGFGLQASLSVAGGVKGGVDLSLGQFSPDFPVTIDPGVTPFVQDGQVFAVDPSLISTTDAQFALNLPQANASLDFGLQAQANLTLSFPGIPIGFSLPFVGFIGYTIHIPSVSIGFKSGTIFKLPTNGTTKIPGNGSVTVGELQALTVNSNPQSAYESLPTLEMSGDTAPFFSANIDLVTLLAQKVPDPFGFLAGSKMFAGGLASLSYHLFSLVVSSNLWLHEDVTLTPKSITESVTDELSGETHSGPLGSVLDFTAPGSGDGIVPLQFTFSLVLAVNTELDLDGNVELTAEGPSVGASILGVSKTIGPLGNFNLFNLSGKLAELYSHTSYETLTSTATVDLQNFSTSVNKTISASSGAVSITQPATNLVVSSSGTVKGTAVAVNTSTLSAAMVDDSGLITASGMGVQLQAGGSVDIEAGGRISGIGAATGAAIMAMKDPIDAVLNYGSITGFAQGVDMLGGSVKNDTGATISAAQIGISITNANASVVNNGLISGAIGIDLANGGGIYNAQSGTIVATEYGVYSRGVVTIQNHCTLTGGANGVRALAGGELMNLGNAYIHGGGAGVILSGAGNQVVGNATGGTISGGKVGVSLTGASTTLIDYGLISGSLAAIELYGQQSNTLVLDPGSRLQGQVRISAVTNTLSLTGAYGGVGTLTGLGEAALPFNALVDISAGAAWNITGALDGSTFSGLNAADTLTDTLIPYAAGERVALNRTTDVLEIFAAGAPSSPIGTIQLAGTLAAPPILSAGAGGAVEISFSSQKLANVSQNDGELYLTPNSFLSSDVTIQAGVTISANYYGPQAQAHGVYAYGQRSTLTNDGTIISSNQSAISFAGGGIVTNQAGALISGPTGVILGSTAINSSYTVTFTNAGTVNAGEGAVYLNVFGTVTNLAGGQLQSTYLNAIQLNAVGNVVNLGTMTAGRHAARLFAGGFVYNEASGLMTSRQAGVDVTGGYGQVVNCGTIQSMVTGQGVYLGAGGIVVNESGAIEGVTDGVAVSGAEGSIANAALIEGILLNAGGMIANAATGTIDGTGVVAAAGGAVTIIDAGAITSTTGVAITFENASDRLIVKSGASFGGAVRGGGGALELAGGIGRITGLGGSGKLSGAETASFSGFGSYAIDVGGSWLLTGTNALAAGHTLSVAGALTIAGTLTDAGSISGATGSRITLATADIAGGTLTSAGAVIVSGVGNILDGTAAALSTKATLTIADKAVLTLRGAIANQGVIVLGGRTAATSLVVGSAGATLSGAGSVLLGASAFNTITGAVTTAKLTNLNNTIKGSGLIGNGVMTLVNMTSGIIAQTGAVAMTINTGTNTVTNAGVIESTGAGGLTIVSAVADSGVLLAAGGILTLDGAVSGAGHAVVDGGRLVFGGADSFLGGTKIESGVLELAAAKAAGAGAITFAPTKTASATLMLDTAALPFVNNVATFASPLVNFGAGGFIDIAGMTYGAGATVALKGDIMTVSSSGKTVNFTLAGALPSLLLVVANDGGGVQINTEGLSTQGELAAAVDAANQTGAGAGVIKLLICGDIDLTQTLAPIDLASGVSLDFEGSGLTVDGAAAGLTIDRGSVTMEDWNFEGPLNVAKGASFSGYGVIGGMVSNNGQIEAKGGSLTLAGDVGGAGDIVIVKGANLVLGAGDSQAIEFVTGGGRLTLDAPAKVTGLIKNFSTGDVIDLAGVTATNLHRSGATVTIYDGGRLVATLDIAGTAGREIYSLSSDGGGGTEITASPWTQLGAPTATISSATPAAVDPGAAAGQRFLQFAAGHLVRPATSTGLGGASTDRAFLSPMLARP